MTPRLRLSDPLLRVQSDERLAALAGHGGERAFAILVERHRSALLAFARRLGAGGAAEDVVQQALLQAWSALRRGTEVEHVSAWMHRIVRNAAIRAAASRLDGVELPATLVAASATADEVELRHETRRLLEEIERLPARQREVLVRLAVAGGTGEEVGRAMDLEPNAVRQLAHRARTRLRTAMGACVPWPLALWAARGGGGVGAGLPEAIGGAGVAGGTGVAATLLKLGAIASTTVAVAVGAGSVAGRHHHHHRAAEAAATPVREANGTSGAEPRHAAPSSSHGARSRGGRGEDRANGEDATRAEERGSGRGSEGGDGSGGSGSGDRGGSGGGSGSNSGSTTDGRDGGGSGSGSDGGGDRTTTTTTTITTATSGDGGRDGGSSGGTDGGGDGGSTTSGSGDGPGSSGGSGSDGGTSTTTTSGSSGPGG